MKKILVMLLSLCMLLTACTNPISSLFRKSRSEVPESTEQITDTNLKIGFILPFADDSPAGISKLSGIRKMQARTGLNDTNVMIKYNVKKDEVTENVDGLVDNGCTLLFVCDARYEEHIGNCANTYPDVTFLLEGSSKTGLPANVYTYRNKLYEAYYVAGVIAGKKINELLNEGKIPVYDCRIGFVASRENEDSLVIANAFFKGVRENNSSATITTKYVGKTGNYDADASAVKALIDNGAGFICQYTTTTAAAAVCSENGVPFVGCDINMIDQAPGMALTSCVQDFSVYYTYAVEAFAKGDKIEKNWEGGYKEGAVLLSKLNDGILAGGSMTAVKEYEAKLRQGTAVFDGEAYKNTKLWQ